MNVILCGMMGAGKTCVGIKLSELTGMRWYDTDEMVVGKYGKIADIFEYYGEPHFRTLETEMVRRVAAENDCVVSTGGGCLLRPENAYAFKESGKIVFLRTSADTVFRRVGHTGADRPLLKGAAFEKINDLLRARTPVYEGCADFIVDTDDKTVEEIALCIMKEFSLPQRGQK